MSRGDSRAAAESPQDCRSPETVETVLSHTADYTLAAGMDTGRENLPYSKFVCPVCSYAHQKAARFPVSFITAGPILPPGGC